MTSLDDLNKQVTDVPCPDCGDTTLTVEIRLALKDIGTYSIAGNTPPLVADEMPHLVCPCGYVEPPSGWKGKGVAELRAMQDDR